MIKISNLTRKRHVIPADGMRRSFLFRLAYSFMSEHVTALLDEYIGTYWLDQLD
jgi:hypothetical protein